MDGVQIYIQSKIEIIKIKKAVDLKERSLSITVRSQAHLIRHRDICGAIFFLVEIAELSQLVQRAALCLKKRTLHA